MVKVKVKVKVREKVNLRKLQMAQQHRAERLFPDCLLNIDHLLDQRSVLNFHCTLRAGDRLILHKLEGDSIPHFMRGFFKSTVRVCFCLRCSSFAVRDFSDFVWLTTVSASFKGHD